MKREELIQALEQCGNGICDDHCPFINYFVKCSADELFCMEHLMRETAKYLRSEDNV